MFTGTIVHSYLPSVFNVEFSNCFNLTVEAIRLGIILTQVYHLLVVALIHYIGTLKPLQYASILNPECLKVIVTALWTIPSKYIYLQVYTLACKNMRIYLIVCKYMQIYLRACCKYRKVNASII